MAETIETALLQSLTDRVLNIARLRGLGSDGAAVTTGRVTGLATRLKCQSHRMISVDYVDHKLALAAAHAVNGVPHLQSFKSILQTLFFFYQNSAVRMASVHAIQEVLG